MPNRKIIVSEKPDGFEIKRRSNYSFNAASHPHLKIPQETKGKTIIEPTFLEFYWNKFFQVMKQEKVYNTAILVSFTVVLIIAIVFF